MGVDGNGFVPAEGAAELQERIAGNQSRIRELLDRIRRLDDLLGTAALLGRDGSGRGGLP